MQVAAHAVQIVHRAKVITASGGSMGTYARRQKMVQTLFVLNAILQRVDCSAGDSRSAEMRYESAWRMGQWQRGAEQSGTVPGRPVRANEAILGCLKVSFSSIGHRYPLPLPLPLILHPVAPPQALLPFLTPASNPGPNPCPPLPPLVLQLSLT